MGGVISGSMTCTYDDGSEITVGAGDAYYFAPGHDGWVNGDIRCVLYEIVEGGQDFGPWKYAHLFANFATAEIAQFEIWVYPSLCSDKGCI